jgi:acetoin utilization protein AcuB
MSTTTEKSMSTHLVTVRWTEPMLTAYERMKSHRLRHLPVIDDQGYVAGMLSDRDVQRAMVSDPSSDQVRFPPEARARDYMGWPVLTVDRNAELGAVAKKMLGEKVSALLVQDHGRPVGIITTDDLLKVLIELLDTPGSPGRRPIYDYFGYSGRDFGSTLI